MIEPEKSGLVRPFEAELRASEEANTVLASILSRVKVVADARNLLNQIEEGAVSIRDFQVMWPDGQFYQPIALVKENVSQEDASGESKLYIIEKKYRFPDANGGTREYPEGLGKRRFYLQPIIFLEGQTYSDTQFILPTFVLRLPYVDFDVDLCFKPPPLEEQVKETFRKPERFLKKIKSGNPQRILEDIRAGKISLYDFLMWINHSIEGGGGGKYEARYLIREEENPQEVHKRVHLSPNPRGARLPLNEIERQLLLSYSYYEIHRFPSGDCDIFPISVSSLLYSSEDDSEDNRLWPVETKEKDPNQKPKAFITGVAGQDGSYLAEFLLDLGYDVYGCDRRGPDSENIIHLKDRLHWVDVDLSDTYSVRRALRNVGPDEIYHLAAFTHVGESFDSANASKVMNDVWITNFVLITAAQLTVQETGKQIKYFYPGTSELFGNEPPPQNEDTSYSPQSPYAFVKAAAGSLVKKYSAVYGIYAPDVILFNHGSVRRPDKFVERKISKAVARVHFGLIEKEKFGNIRAIRDWGHAAEYVVAIHTIMQQAEAGKFVIGTGEGYSVQELLEHAFSLIGEDWRNHIEIDRSLFRPREVNALIADITKARRELGWNPQVRGKQLIEMLVKHDLEELGISLGQVPPKQT